MRNAFADEITKLGKVDPRIVLLSGDIGNRLFDRFKESNPERFFNCGVAEGNMMGVASGLGLCGLRPVVYTITPFTTTRCLEQIRVDACYHNSPVLIVGTGSGLSYASLGPTHHSCEDMGLLRLLPGMTVLAPCDAIELRLALKEALELDGPVYMRIGKKGEPLVHETPPRLRIGKAINIRQGSDVALVSTGNMMPAVLDTADRLAANGISARVESFHTVKPLDEELLTELFNTYPVVAVVEEHTRLGGLGGSIAEWLAAHYGLPGRLLAFGTADEFLHEVGSQSYARGVFGLTAENFTAAITSALDEATHAAPK